MYIKEFENGLWSVVYLGGAFATILAVFTCVEDADDFLDDLV
jgi:hypothetical protein